MHTFIDLSSQTLMNFLNFINDLFVASGFGNSCFHVRDEYLTETESETSKKPFSIGQCLTLAKHVSCSSIAEDKNLVFSALSIHIVLGLIATGSNKLNQEKVLDYFKSKSCDDLNSSVLEIVSELYADGQSLGGPCLSCVNGVWVDKRFVLKKRFKEIAEYFYKAAVEQVDFVYQAEMGRKKINLWAEEKTNGLIDEVLPPGSVDALTRLIFGTAVYFKGAWEQNFNESITKDHNFFLLNGSSVKAPFMTSSRKQYVSAFNGFKVLSLPYKRGEDERRFSMSIFLPDSTSGLPALVEKVTGDPRFVERHLPHKVVQVGKFRIPKFKICFDFDATKVLDELGAVSLFSCSLSEMVNEGIFVSTIMHKSFIEVNEGGTEAAAITYDIELTSCLNYSPPDEKIDFVADHPFLFLIREDTTGMLLFIGHLLNPQIK